MKKAMFSEKHPIWTVVLFELLIIFATFAAGAYATITQQEDFPVIVVAFVPIALITAVYLSIGKKWSSVGFCSLSTISKKDWLYYTPLLLVFAAIFLSGFDTKVTLSAVGFQLVQMLLVGFVEETVYRGVILHALMRKGAVTAVVVSSILFSITHILNVMSGQSLPDTLFQIAYALLIGVALALLMVKNCNIYPLIFFHFFHNWIRRMTLESMPFNIVILIVLAVMCIWLILDLKKEGSRLHPNMSI